MEAGSVEDETRGRSAPTLPGAPSGRGSENGAGEARPRSLAISRAGTFQRTGYAGLVPPLLSLQPSASPTPAAEGHESPVDGAAPALPATGVALLEPTPSHDPAPAQPEPDVVSVDPNTGLPMHPTGEITPTPQWSSRRPGPARKVVTVLLILALAGLVVAAIWAGVNAYLPGENASPAPENAATAQAISPAAGGASVRPEVAALFAELDRGRQRSAAVDGAGSYRFRWVDRFGFAFTVQVDSATGDFMAVTGQDAEIIHVDDRYFGRSKFGAFVELTTDAGAVIPSLVLGGPLTADDALPAPVAEFVVAEGDLPDGRPAALVDDARLAAERPAARQRWLEPWGLLPAEEAPAPVENARVGLAGPPAPGQVLVVFDVDAEGGVVAVTVTSPAIGGSAYYGLLDASAAPLLVQAPTTGLDG